jgi:hypothetical protein
LGDLSIRAGVFRDFAGLADVAGFAAFFIGQEYFFRVGSKARKSEMDGSLKVGWPRPISGLEQSKKAPMDPNAHESKTAERGDEY